MVQMFGLETWTKRWGDANEEWSAALNPLPANAVTTAISRVRNSGLKLYELDLPTFLAFAKPEAQRVQTAATVQPVWMPNLTDRQRDFMRQANFLFLSWLDRQPLETNERLRKDPACLGRLVAAKNQIALDFHDMEAELGRGEVTKKDLQEALERRWQGLCANP